ncbi:hypothetical protein [Marinobacter nauticus]|uniref:hypothetical protein n=1 Tax=Marinobacter nauticus TaxID=2743 RepID=UPI001C99A8A8|nr:hypothetical protein [Marinobacter nauticus]MBY5938038.1 hypothetical protein [Marinobacter nauticus]MBY5955267.1 hypothetical protein [Marinobacter nauticus]MBY6009058.1 hypothetical protein [Marinobacter nauticus]
MAKNLDLQVVLAARDKLTKPLKKIDATTTGTARALKQAQAETKQLQNSQRDISSFRRMDDALGKNAKALAESQERVRRLGHELRTTSKPTAKLRNEYNKARQEVEKFTRKGQDQRKELGKVRKRLSDAGVDVRNLSGEQRRLADQMQATNNRIQRQRKYLDQLGKADISGKFSNMTGEVGRFGRRTAMVGAGAAAGIFGIANSTATLGDQVAKTGDKIGIALGPFQELRYAAERSGVSTEKFDSSLERFIKRMGEATQGTGAARKAYEELGLSAEDLAKLTPEQSLEVVADRLSSVENQSQRVAIAAQLFGREGVAMVNMLKDGSSGLQALRRDARATGYVLSEQAARDAEAFKDAMLDAQLGMAGMKNTIGAELMPAITDMMGDLSSWMRENRDQVSAFASNFGTKLKNAIPVLRDIAVGAASTAKTLGMITSHLATMVGGFDNLGMILAVVLAMKPIMAILSFGKAIFMATSAVVGLAGGLPAVAAGIKAIGVALTANPIGLIIAAIAGAGYLIYKNWGAIMDFFKSLPAKFSGFGSMIMDGLVGGLLGGLKKVKDTIVNTGQKTIGWFKGVLGIKSPSRVFMSAGQDTLEGYRKGIQKQEPAALKQVSGFGKRVRSVGAGIAIGASALPAAAGVQFDNRPPIATATPSAATAGDSVTINVYAAPGQSEREIAAQVDRILQERDRRIATRARSALYDRE